MKRDLIIGMLVALLLHGGLALGGDFFFKNKPTPPPVDDTIPVVELAPLPPVEPEMAELPAPSGEGGGSVSDLVPPMQADTSAPAASAFLHPIQPPPPPAIARSSGPIIPVGRPGAGLGTGAGTGFQNLFDLASLDQPPVVRVAVKPIFPYEMSRAGINGQVVVGFIVDAEGNVKDPYVISSTHREFETESLRAISRYKFKPGRKNGVAVSTRNVSLPFVFSLKGGD